jgi:hypothetical protein
MRRMKRDGNNGIVNDTIAPPNRKEGGSTIMEPPPRVRRKVLFYDLSIHLAHGHKVRGLRKKLQCRLHLRIVVYKNNIPFL